MRNRTLLAAISIVLSACGSDDGPTSPPAPSAPVNFTVGGSVTGLAGTLVLQNSGANDLTVTTNGAFVFGASVPSGAAYAVSVMTQPPNQTCAVAGATGTATANITNVAITCTTNVVSVGGALSGLRGTIVLQNNAAGDLTLAADGNFSFNVPQGSNYSIAVQSQSTTLVGCSVANATGTAAAAITNISVTCTDRAPSLSMSARSIKQLRAAWTFAGDTPTGITRFELREDPDGATGYTVVDGNIAPAATHLDRVVALHLRVQARYILSACDATLCLDSNTATVATLSPGVGYLKASVTSAAGALGLGLDVSADGNTLAIGLTNDDSSAIGIDGNEADTSASNSGAVYVYTRDGAEWTRAAYIKATNTGANDQFGSSVALSADGSTLVVGATGEDSDATGVGGDQTNDLASGSGAAYVYERNGNTWVPSAYLKATNAEANDSFGSAVSISDDAGTIAVGASQEDGNANGVLNSGAAYVYTRSGAAWLAPAGVLRASNPGMSDNFGMVALSADGATLLVGAFAEESCATGVDGDQTNNACNDSGAAYIFTSNAGAWTQQAYLKATNTGVGDMFGLRLAISADGNAVAVGARFEDSSATGTNGNGADNALADTGAVYLFRRSAGVWSPPDYIKPSRQAPGAQFGSSMALSQDGTILAIGASSDPTGGRGLFGNASFSTGSALDSGSIYIVEYAAGEWRYRSYLKSTNADPGDFFGGTLSMSADGEVLVGAATGEDSATIGLQGDQDDNGAPNSGAVFIF